MFNIKVPVKEKDKILKMNDSEGCKPVLFSDPKSYNRTQEHFNVSALDVQHKPNKQDCNLLECGFLYLDCV